MNDLECKKTSQVFATQWWDSGAVSFTHINPNFSTYCSLTVTYLNKLFKMFLQTIDFLISSGTHFWQYKELLKKKS